MFEIIQFFSNYSIWVYFLLIVGFVFAIRKLILNLREQRSLVFGLEREITHRRINQALATMVVVVMIMMAEFFLVTILEPALPAMTLISTGTMNPLQAHQVTSTSELAQTTGTPIIGTTPSQITGCIPGQIMVTDPKPGQQIRGEITLVGTADIPNLGFYKYEFAPQGSDTWTTILAGNKIVVDDSLGFWNTSELTPGDYQLRLIVSDNSGSEYPACIIPIQIIN
jgi:hypothetical protein